MATRNEEPEEPLDPKQGPELGEGQVAVVFRREAARSFNAVLFLRSHLIDHVQKVLNGFWNNEIKSRLYVEGPPGCGKTCFFHLWTRILSTFHQKRVLIVQFRAMESCFIWIRESDGVLRLMKKSFSAKLYPDTESVVDGSKSMFDLCLHDGVVDGPDNHVLGFLNARTGPGEKIRKVIHVTSMGFRLSTGGNDLGDNGPIVRMSVDSWKEEEYKQAVANDRFLELLNEKGSVWSSNLAKQEITGDDAMDDEDEEEGGNQPIITGEMAKKIVELKYFYAGGSARFMFDFNLESLKQTLKSSFDELDSQAWEELGEHCISPRSNRAVNTLMQRFGGKTAPVSHYVLQAAFDKSREKLVQSVRTVANETQNPALQGWAFELEQLNIVHAALKSIPNHPIVAENKDGMSFRPTSEATFTEDALIGNVKDGTVIWCKKWNQGCFDVAFYQDRTLITLQFTIAKKHSLKLQFVRKLRKAILANHRELPLTRFVHVGVREDRWETLTFEAAQGTGRQKGTESSEFDIETARSSKLESVHKTSAAFRCELIAAAHRLGTISMWQLARDRAEVATEMEVDESAT